MQTWVFCSFSEYCLTLGSVCWDVHSWEDCSTVLTHTKMLHTNKMPKLVVTLADNQLIKCIQLAAANDPQLLFSNGALYFSQDYK